MKRMLLIVSMFCVLAGCGGGGEDGAESPSGEVAAADTAPAASLNFAGRWTGQLFRGEDPCGVIPDESADGGVYIQQTGSDVVVYLGGLCSASLTGQASGDNLSARSIVGTMDCSDGQEAAIIETFDIEEVAGSPQNGIATLGFEAGCSDQFCRGEMVGTVLQESTDSLACRPDSDSSSSGGATAAPTATPVPTPSQTTGSNPTATPTPKPTPKPTPSNRCDRCSLKGCCSRHGGVASCPGGAVICGDGTRSPSCTC